MAKPLTRLGFSSKIQERLQEAGTPFSMVETSSSKRIECTVDGVERSFFLTDSPLSGSELSFLTGCKKHIINRGCPATDWNPANISYFKFRNKPVGIHKGIVEIDINGAYWSAAHSLGYISKAVYERGKNVSKKARLITLGSLATRRKKFEFDGKVLRYSGQEFDAKQASWFFHIAGHIGKIMSDFFNTYRAASYFYWVDAMFLSDTFSEIFIDYLAENGLECKIIPTDFLQIVENERFFSYKIFQNKKEKVFLRLKSGSKANFLSEIKEIENE